MVSEACVQDLNGECQKNEMYGIQYQLIADIDLFDWTQLGQPQDAAHAGPWPECFGSKKKWKKCLGWK